MKDLVVRKVSALNNVQVTVKQTFNITGEMSSIAVSPRLWADFGHQMGGGSYLYVVDVTARIKQNNSLGMVATVATENIFKYNNIMNEVA